MKKCCHTCAHCHHFLNEWTFIDAFRQQHDEACEGWTCQRFPKHEEVHAGHFCGEWKDKALAEQHKQLTDSYVDSLNQQMAQTVERLKARYGPGSQVRPDQTRKQTGEEVSTLGMWGRSFLDRMDDKAAPLTDCKKEKP